LAPPLKYPRPAVPYKDKADRRRAYYRLNKKNGILLAKYRRMDEKAGRPRPNTCEVCGDNGRICFDHDHETNEFRGWICHMCNSALGLVKDNPDKLRKLAMYIEFHNQKRAQRPIGSV
jgi:Recombination endonuclease VII